MDKTIEDKNETEEFLPDEEFEEETSEEEVSEETPEEGQTSEEKTQKELKSKDIKSALAQKEHWRKKYQELEKKLEELKKGETKETPKAPENERLEKIEFLMNHREINSKEFLDDLAAYARGRSISLEEAYKSETMQSALKALQEKSRKEAKIPAPSSRSATIGGKSHAELSPEELTEKFPDVVDKILRARSKIERFE